MLYIDERRDTPRERRKHARNQLRREKSKGKFDLRDMSPFTYLLAAMAWLAVVLGVIDELSK